ncbi:MAG: hypothetical protein JSV80_14035, partial [Acidobacteriota bacterium]
EQLLDALPLGSLGFAMAVSQRFWPGSTSEELAALALIAEKRVLVPEGTARAMVLRAVALRQRAQKLQRTDEALVSDPAALLAMGGELTGLACLTSETNDYLEGPATESVPKTAQPVLEAAALLLPSPLDLEVLATLAEEMARQCEAIQGSHKIEPEILWVPIEEVHDVLRALELGRVEPDQLVLWEVYATCSLSRRDLDAGADATCIERDRHLAALVLQRLETAIDRAMSAHKRDPAAHARHAAWRRLMLETRARLDERLTRQEPVEETIPLARTSEKAEAPLSASAPADPDQAILKHFRNVRSEPLVGAAEPPAGVSWLWWFTGIGLALAALILVVTLFLPPATPPTAAVSPDHFEAIVPLIDTTPAGALFVATLDPSWEQLTREDQMLGATRLMTAAEQLGFRAGLLMSPDGRPLAVWSPGRDPAVVASTRRPSR